MGKFKYLEICWKMCLNQHSKVPKVLNGLAVPLSSRAKKDDMGTGLCDPNQYGRTG